MSHNPIMKLLPALLWMALAATVCAAGVGHEIVRESDGERVVLWNDRYRLTFDPARGGRCSSFRVLATDREWVYDGATGGLFQDHFISQSYPGELLEAAYAYDVTQDGESSVCIRLWTTCRRSGVTQGLEVRKEITLRAGRRDVAVVNAFVNPTEEGRNVGLWVQQCFFYGGDRAFDLYYRPSTHGIHLAGLNDEGKARYIPTADAYSADFVGAGKYTDAGGREPVAGWTAGRDRRTDEGAVFVLDYNYLDVLYNSVNSYTTEWFLDPVSLPPGREWSTAYRVIPVDGFTGFAHASPRLIANTAVDAREDETRITHQLAGTVEPAGDLTVHTRVYGVRSQSEDALPPLEVKGVGLHPVTVTQSWPRAQTEPLVIRVTVGRDTDIQPVFTPAGAGSGDTGGTPVPRESGAEPAGTAGWQESYEYLFEGAFAGSGIHGAGEIAEYTVPRPPKVKDFLKPDSWARPVNAHPRVLFLYGLYSHLYRIEEAVRAIDPEAEIVVSREWDTFPPTYETLLGFDAIVLSDVPAGPDYANQMVWDVVRHGGVGLLALGGIRTFGGGQWIGTRLENVLPGTIRSGFDMDRHSAGRALTLSAAHPVGRDVVFPAEARVYWTHDLTPREEARVIVRAGDAPALIAGDCGAGRTVAVSATCHGEAGRGAVEAWNTDAWLTLMTQTMRWLLHE